MALLENSYIFHYYKVKLKITLTTVLLIAVSTFTKGKQMVPVLNGIKVACAVCGNHDFGNNLILLGNLQLINQSNVKSSFNIHLII